MKRFILSLLISTLQICTPAFAQTYIKGPALIQGVTSTVSAAGTTVLTKGSQTVQVITGSTTQTFTLPDATTLPVGRPFEFYNLSSGAVTIRDASLVNIRVLAASDHTKFTVVTNSTAAGLWSYQRVTIALTDSLLTGVLPIAKGGTNSNTSLNNNRVIQSSGGALVEASAITASRALVSDANGIPTHSAATSTEVGYLSGVTSALQTQIDSKSTKTLTSAHIFVGNGSNIATDVAVTGDIAITNAGVTSYSGTVPLNKGGTGTAAGSANAAFNALAPSQGSNSGKFLTTNGTDTSWAAAGVSTQGQSEGSSVSTLTLKAPYNQITTTGTDERMIETGNGNLLLNPSYEHSTFATSWGALGDTTAAPETTVIRHGKKSAKLTLAAQSGNFWFQDVTPTIQMTGMDMEHSLRVKTAVTGVQVCARNAGAVVGTCTNVLSDNVWHYYPINYPGPSSGSVGVTLNSPSGSTGDVYVDDAYVGIARNIGTTAQTIYAGGIRQAGASNCLYGENTSTGLNDFIALGSAGSCASAWTTIGSYVTATGTTAHSAVLNGPSGEYQVKIKGNFYADAAAQACNFRLSDGTTTYEPQAIVSAAADHGVPMLEFHVSYTGGAKTYTIQAADNGAGTCYLINNATGRQASWDFYAFLSQAQTAVRMDQAGWYVDATMDGANPDMGVSNVTSYTEITSSTLTLKPQSGSAAVGTMCSSTNAATAPSTSNTTCAAGSESVGINFAIPKSGAYEVCFIGASYYSVDSGERLDNTFQLIETPTNAQTLTLEGGTKQAAGVQGMTIASGTTSGIIHPLNNCSIFNWTSSGTKGVRLMYEQNVTGTPNNSLIVADASANDGQRNMRWTVKPWNNLENAPLLVGGVTSSSTGLERVERAKITGGSATTSCTSSPCTILSQSGDWVTSVARSGTGVYAFTLPAGKFSSAPSCVAMGNNGAQVLVFNVSGITTTALSVNVYDNGAAARDAYFDVICQGPR